MKRYSLVGLNLEHKVKCARKPIVFLHINKEVTGWIMKKLDESKYKKQLKWPPNLDKCEVNIYF